MYFAYLGWYWVNAAENKGADPSAMNVSVVIPVYNRQRDGERAVRSALGGGEPMAEVIIVDDASSPPFVLPSDLATDGRVRLVRHKVNQGESAARNTGIAEAGSDWIAFLDSDDYWLAQKLAEQVAFAAADQAMHPNPMTFYAHGFVQINENTGRRRALIPAEGGTAGEFASGCWFMQGSTVLIHKQAAAASGPCDPNLRRMQDLDWFMRIALAGGRLKVAPFIGSVILVGARPSPEAIEVACKYIEGKWFSDQALPADMRRLLSAYLDVERAASRRYAGQMFGAAYYLVRSLVKAPRPRVPLKRWWDEVDLPLDIRPARSDCGGAR